MKARVRLRASAACREVVEMLLPEELPAKWRATASLFRRHAEEPVALAYERCVEDLEEALQVRAAELLTLTEAAAESGYSADHLGRLVREGKVPNAGRPGAPKIRRGDLPRKAGALPPAPVRSDAPSAKSAIVRSVVTEGA